MDQTRKKFMTVGEACCLNSDRLQGFRGKVVSSQILSVTIPLCACTAFSGYCLSVYMHESYSFQLSLSLHVRVWLSAFLVFYFSNTSLIPCRNFGSTYTWTRQQQPQEHHCLVLLYIVYNLLLVFMYLFIRNVLCECNFAF